MRRTRRRCLLLKGKSRCASFAPCACSLPEEWVWSSLVVRWLWWLACCGCLQRGLNITTLCVRGPNYMAQATSGPTYCGPPKSGWKQGYLVRTTRPKQRKMSTRHARRNKRTPRKRKRARQAPTIDQTKSMGTQNLAAKIKEIMLQQYSPTS